jgi:uncharacterized protein involved in exopolysaccharide biosynthesis
MRELTATTAAGRFIPPGTDDVREESFGVPVSGSRPAETEWLAPWRALSRHKHLLIAGAALGALLGVLCSIPQTPVYEAGALIEVRGFNENFLNLGELNPTNAGVSQQAADADTAVRTMTSRSLLASVVDKLSLDTKREFVVASRLAAWRGALGLPESDSRPPRVKAIDLAARHLSVSTVGKAKLVAVRCESVDPALATAFVDTLIEEFVAQSADSRWQANRRTEEWLGRQLEDLRVKLESSEQALQDYARSNGLLLTSDRDSIAEEKLRQLQTTEQQRGGAGTLVVALRHHQVLRRHQQRGGVVDGGIPPHDVLQRFGRIQVEGITELVLPGGAAGFDACVEVARLVPARHRSAH